MRSHSIGLSLTYFTCHNASRSNHVVTGNRISSFLTTKWYSTAYIYYNLCIYSSINEHKCCCVLAIINNAVIDTGVQTFFWVSDFISFGFIPRSRTARSHDSSIFNYLRNFHTIFHSGYINLYSYQMHTGSPFSTTSSVISSFWWWSFEQALDDISLWF